MEFEDYDEGLLFCRGNEGEKKLFLDYDGTIILQKNGKCPTLRKSGDWRFVYPNVVDVLNLYDSIIIITNQKNLKREKKEGFIIQIKEVFSKINKKPWVFAAVQDDNYRKPNTGMIKVISGMMDISGDNFYVGDACGRETDHSACDLHLAENLGWGFQTPEMFFLGKGNNIPKQINIFDVKPQKMEIPKIPENIQILFLQGPPASGKSTISKKLTDFYVINQDELKTLNKCLKMAQEKLKEGKKILIDRTNPNLENMKPFMDLNENCGILSIKIDKLMNKHLNYYRSWKNGTKRIPEIVYNIYWKKYEEPVGFKWKGEVEWRMEFEMEKKWFF